MITHELKISPKYFERIRQCEKTFEVRINDRDFQKGDLIKLCELEDNKFTGRSVSGYIGYVLSDFEGLKEGYVAFSLIIKDCCS